MPSDDAYQAVLAELGKLAEAWRIHREVVNRAINLLNHEVLAVVARFDKDDKARVDRQAQIDAKLEAISAGQEQIKRWQWVRIGVELLAIALVAAYLIGVSR
jgi:hypothetical protein